MFNIKYNFLVLIQIFLNAINALLLIKVFGISKQVDSYLLAISIILTIQLIQLVFFEQFLVFYTDLKIASINKSNDFYNANLFLSCVIGIVSVIILYLFGGLVLKVFSFNIDAQRLDYLKNIFPVLLLGLIFMPVTALNERLLNAEMRFSIPYILSCLPILFVVLAQLTVCFLNQNNIIYLAYGQVFGLALSAIVGTIFIARNLVPFKFVFYHPDIKHLFKNSFTTRLGDNIYSTLLPVTINNLLVAMPVGYVSYFYYAKKIIDTLKLLTIGPSVKILRTNLTNFWVSKNVEKVRDHIQIFLKGSVILMSCGIILSFLILPTALKIVSMGKLSDTDMTNINYIFLSLCPWNLIVLLEAPYILAIFTAKKSKVAIIANTLFILTFFAITYLLKDRVGIYSIAIGGFFAQFINYVIYKNYTEKLLAKLDTTKESEINIGEIVYNTN
ncbi:MAG: hypothetical protein A2039_09730 [Candidatus Melainabacteria bacterium GWA2_34_9]|nr:MAG: hypothetical protein A2039_09730 [Candidatus Melainabacteria bacterium GWA2_34_9]